MIYPRHTSELQVGDKFVFQGLTGQDVDEDTVVEVLGISPSGKLSVRVTVDGEVAFEPGTVLVDYLTARRLIEEDIWKHIEEGQSS